MLPKLWHLNGRATRSLLKSLTSYTIDTNAGAAGVKTQTLSPAVDPNNALIFLTGFYDTTAVATPTEFPRISLATDGSSVTVTQNTTPIATFFVFVTVVEFWPGVLKSVYRDTITCNGVVSNTKTVPKVDVSQAFVTSLGFTANTGANNEFNKYSSVVLTDSTTVTMNQGSNGAYDSIHGFQLFEL